MDVFDGLGVSTVAPELIDKNPFQVRTGEPDDLADEEMARSIADKGVLQPIMIRAVNDRFEQALGERRLRGALLAKRNGWLPADWRMPVMIRDLTDDDMLEIGIVENVQREALHFLDEAAGYRRLADRGRSAAEIQRLVGQGGRKKRSIQELIQFDRELPEDAKRRARLPEADKDRLKVEDLRALVGEKKERPALMLTPKMSMAFLELLDARPEKGGIKSGDVYRVRLYEAPVGGPLIALANTSPKLVEWAFDGPKVFARIRATEDVVKYLDQLAFGQDFTPEREACLAKARAAVIGELQANAMAPDEYATVELNRPDTPEPPPTPAPPSVVKSYEALQRDPDAAEPFVPAQVPSPPVDAAPKPPEPSPAHQVLILEIAHKIGRHGIERGPETWACEVAADYYKDPRCQQLVLAKLAAFMPMQARTLVTLTASARAWLETLGVGISAGRPAVDDAMLLYKQVENDASPRGGAYSTPWLNPAEAAQTPAPAPALPEEGPPPSDPAPPEPAPPPPRDSFSQQLKRVSAETSALQALSAANRAARALLTAATSRKLNSNEVGQMLALLDNADAAARPFLEGE